MKLKKYVDRKMNNLISRAKEEASKVEPNIKNLRKFYPLISLTREFDDFTKILQKKKIDIQNYKKEFSEILQPYIDVMSREY